METLFANAPFFVAYHNSKDENHQAARDLVRGFEGRPILLITTDYLFDEVMTVLLVEAGS